MNFRQQCFSVHNTYKQLAEFICSTYGQLKVTDDSSVNFHDVFYFLFCQIIAKNEEKHVMEIYGWVVRNSPVVCKWTRWIRQKTITFDLIWTKLGWCTPMGINWNIFGAQQAAPRFCVLWCDKDIIWPICVWPQSSKRPGGYIAMY